MKRSINERYTYGASLEHGLWLEILGEESTIV